MKKCSRCNGSGFLFDMMLNEKPCHVCEGRKVIAMTRKEKVEFLIEAIWEIEGVEAYSYHFEPMSDEELDREVDWYDYLLDK